MPLERAFVCQEKIMGVMKQERLYQLTGANQNAQKYFESNLTHYDMPQSSPDLFSEKSTSSPSWSYVSDSLQYTNSDENEPQSDILSAAINNTLL